MNQFSIKSPDRGANDSWDGRSFSNLSGSRTEFLHEVSKYKRRILLCDLPPFRVDAESDVVPEKGMGDAFGIGGLFPFE